MDKNEFIKIFTAMADAYRTEMSRSQIETYYSFLKDYSVEEFKEAVKRIIETKSFMPTIAEIKKTIAEIKMSDVPSAEDEWQEVLMAVRRYGSYREQEALDSLKPYTAYIVKHIGFMNICMATDQTWNRKEFIEEYKVLKDKDIVNFQLSKKL